MLWLYRLLRHLGWGIAESDQILETPEPYEPPLLEFDTVFPEDEGSEPIISMGPRWEIFDGGLEKIPVGRAEMVEVYGDPKVTYNAEGKVRVNRKWERANLSTVPATLIAGYHRRIYMHRKVQPYFKEAMRRSVAACPDYQFLKIGCFAPRHQRHSRTRPLSDHTWAISFDINPKQNKSFRRKPKGPLPFGPGWDTYSDIPKGVIDAWESCGFEWGGRWGNGASGGYCDPMHMSLRKTR